MLARLLKAILFLGVTLAGTASGAVFLLPAALDYQPVVILSGSMEPTLNVGGLAVIEPTDPEQIEAGDVISFEAPSDPEILITHRVIEIASKEPFIFQTQGDAVEDPDPFTVPADTVAGTVRFDAPHLGHLLKDTSDFVRTRLGFAVLMGLPGVLLVGSETRNIWFWTSPRKRRGRIRKRRMEKLRQRSPKMAQRWA